MTNAKPDTMQAAAIDGFGGAELVTVRAVPVPEVGPSDETGHRYVIAAPIDF
ncbi:hypothetical protein [Mesorhizobium sp.]|uniref:hypothetical protein n=1 Tax=Mesorhizobium sp. TaxID=1871066 RepID=UPI00257D0F2B|nr:hypothetical protein [Mesorhizobium sp.]